MIQSTILNFRSGNFGSKLGKSGKIGISSWGVKIWNFLKFYFFDIFVLLIWVFCENLSENEAKSLILEQTRFLRVLTRKYWFSVNMPSTKGHNYWTQLPTTMKFCQNVPHMYILKAKKFQVWKNISKPRLGNFGQKIGGIGENLKFFSVGGPKMKIFEI